MSEQVGSVTRKKSSDFHGGIRFQSSFTIRWELEDENFLKIDIICLDDSLKYRNKWKLHTFLQQRDFQKASRNGLGNRVWIDTRNTRLLSVKVKCTDPGVALHDQKPDMGDSLRHQIPAPCPHSPPTGFTLIGAKNRKTNDACSFDSWKARRQRICVTDFSCTHTVRYVITSFYRYA